MSDETTPTKEEQPKNPLENLDPAREIDFLMGHAAFFVMQYLESKMREHTETGKNTEIGIDAVAQAVGQGLGVAAQKLKKGLVPLSPQEMQLVGTFREIARNKPKDEEIALTTIKRKDVGPTLIDPRGQPLNQEAKLILPK